MLAGDLTRIWSEVAIKKEKKLAEYRSVKTRRDLLEEREQEEDSSVLMAAAEMVLQASAQRIQELQLRIDALDSISLKALIEATRQLDEIRSNANHAEDGRLVFEADDGSIYDEHGGEVGRDEIDLATWRDEASSWSQYRSADRTKDKIQELRNRVLEQQNRLSDDPDLQDLDDIEAEIDAIEAELRADPEPKMAEAKLSSNKSYAESIDPFFNADISIAAAFHAAATNEPNEQPQRPEPDAQPYPVPSL